MAVQLPAMQKLGRQLGVNLDVVGEDGPAGDNSTDSETAGDDT